MPRNQPEHSYPIENLEIEVNGRELKINGYAKYVLEDQSSGEQGDASSLFACFTRLKVTDWTNIVKTDKDAQGLTKNDLKAIEDSILDSLNENFELCEYLANLPEEGDDF
jgi:hypothetical protein